MAKYETARFHKKHLDKTDPEKGQGKKQERKLFIERKREKREKKNTTPDGFCFSHARRASRRLSLFCDERIDEGDAFY